MLKQQTKRREREEKILLRLDEFRYGTIKQLQIAEKLGGYRNAHRIIHRLEKEGAIKSVRMEQKVYYVSNKGKERIGSKKPNLKRGHIEHALMRNDLYIQLGMPLTWKNEAKIFKGNEIFLISDARFERNGVKYFVEVDNLQTMRTNYDKIKKYKELFATLYKQDQTHPVLIWYTKSPVRKKKLEEKCRQHKINYQIH